MGDKKGIFLVWAFFLAVLGTTISSGVLATNVLFPGQGKGVFGLGRFEDYFFAVFMAAAGGCGINAYWQWKTPLSLRYISLLFALTAFYHAVNFLFVFSILTTFVFQFLICGLMAAIMVQHYFFSKARRL